MDNPFKVPTTFFTWTSYSNLPALFQVIKDVESYRDKLLTESELSKVSLDELSSEDRIVSQRKIDVSKRKVEIVDEALIVLNGPQKYIDEASQLYQLLLQCPNYRMTKDYESLTLSFWAIPYSKFINIILSFIERFLKFCATQLDELDSGYKSPYDFSSVIDDLLKSLDLKSNFDSHIQVKSLLKLVQSELKFINKAKEMNEGQLMLIKISCDKLNLLNDKLSSVDMEMDNKPKQTAKKLRDIVNGIRLIVKETFGLLVALKTNDQFDESHEIFATINDKGADSFGDVIDYMEASKKNWIESKVVNRTDEICRLATLRRYNIYIKQLKKLSSMKSQLGSDCIILGMKNITTSFNKVRKSSAKMSNSAYYLTCRLLPGPTVDVPDGFIRDDIIYKELNSNPHQHLTVVLIHLIKYIHYLNTLPWNAFQDRKPREVCDKFINMVDVIEAATTSDFSVDELHSISLDLADRLCLAKIKIAYDRDALEYRLYRYKPKKPLKATFPELQKIMVRARLGKSYLIRDYIEENFEEMINGFNRKVTNRGQMIIIKSGMEMMKRSMSTLKLKRPITGQENYLSGFLFDQSLNEFCYVLETLGKLLDNFRPNRRTPFSFNADGKFTKQINEFGLGMKKDFEMEINSQIEKLKEKIKENEENLESIKDEKIQLRYLISIVNRSKLIPIKEIELDEKDEIEILREIIEEYEYIMICYGPID